MKRPGVVLVGCGVLGSIIVIGAGMQGAATFSGLRWVPDFSPPTNVPVLPPNTRNSQTSLPQSGQHGSTSIDIGLVLWVAVGVAALVALLLLIRWLARRPARTAESIPAPELALAEDEAAPAESAEPDTPIVRRGLRQAIEDLTAERTPHDAIVKAWLGLQDAAQDAGVRRRAAETPTEFTGRVLSRVPADTRAVDTLLACYLQVRFGNHPVTDDDVARVRGALESLAASWEAAEQTRRASVPAPPWERMHTDQQHTVQQPGHQHPGHHA